MWKIAACSGAILIVQYFFWGCRYRLLADNRQLEIARSQVIPDTARYTCIAMSEAGVADRDFDLDVLGMNKKVPEMINKRKPEQP